MNKELQKLLKQINDKKNEVKSLVNDGKLDKARAAKEELVELQNRFDLLYDLDEDEQDDIVNIGLHFFHKDVRPMQLPVKKYSTVVA